MEKKCIKAFVNGRVQGVFFRDSTRRTAKRLNINGHAINLSDGRVEVLACGEVQQIDELVDWLNAGPQYAQVTQVEVEVTKTENPASFTIG